MSVPLCSVEACEHVATKRGWCDTHYTRWRKYGDPLVVHRSRKPLSVEIGATYGRLTVLAQDGTHRGRDRSYLCRCECGSTTTVVGYSLKSGNTQSCGCLRRDRAAERRTTHGQTANLSRTPTYETWRGMRRRCQPNDKAGEWYFDRGIRVCERWESFANFLADMGERPEGMTLDRIDPDGNYEPENCRWATPAEQSLNQRPRARLSEVARLRHLVEAQRLEIERLSAPSDSAG